MPSEKEKFYITTPIYYVNAEPHIGHTYTTVAADVLARYHRLIGDNTFFATGTDEHGAKISQKAKIESKKPKEFTDEIATKFQMAWDEMNISNNRFIRTTEEAHKKAVQNALRYMYDKGDIYLDKYEGYYCTGCEQFKNEKDLVEGKCPDHQVKPEWVSEETYVFKMSKYAKTLEEKIKKDELKIYPESRKNEILSFYKNENLKDISFSRKNVKWGIELPWDKAHTAYVWSDAFLNYLTILDWDGSGKKCPEMFPPEMQLMSKDILRVHATIWPAMLLSLDLPLQKVMFVHGFFLVDGQKMSKSIGNVIAPKELVKRYGVDATRYLLMSATTFGRDGDIGWKKFDEKYTADLANGVGNLVARTSNLLEKNEIKIDLKSGEDKKIIKDFYDKMDKCKLNEAVQVIWDKFRAMDEYLSEKAPWKMDNIDEKKEVLIKVAQNILNSAQLLQIIMPETAEKIIKQFSAKQIKKGKALFPRLEK
ncbi:MAG: methionine--tRNA ligase [Patescibacteria group bacterium]|nr:methionine--tRNA ligase [Patescibacteria group bacterium]